MQLPAPLLETIRTQPQSSNLSLAIFQPNVIFQAQITDPLAAQGDRVILYGNVTTGSYTAIESGMTMLVGSFAGGQDIGRIRVRDASGTYITTSENNNIGWASGQYVTVLRYWEVWPIYPTIINDPNNANNTLWYKDFNIPYTNQNSVLGTFVCAGPHRAGQLINGQTSFWYSSTGTYNLLGDALTYDWAFEGGTPTGSTLADPGWVTYNTPGNYVTRFRVTDSVNGTVDTTYRYVVVNANPQYQRWTLQSLDGARTDGFYTAKVVLYDTVTINDNSVAIIYGIDQYGSNQISLGGNYPNSSNIFFVGHIQKDTIQKDYQKSTVTFDVLSITGIMKDTETFSVSVQSVANPQYWYQLLDMDCRRALYHCLRWHSTVLYLADFAFVGQDQKIQYFDATQESLYDAVNTFMQNTLVGEVVCDRQGKIWAEITAAATPNATGTFTPVMYISSQNGFRDWIGSPEIDEIYDSPTSYLGAGGIAYSGVNTGTYSAILAAAPGNAPAFRGTVPSELEGLALTDQNQLNQLVGNLLANQNARFPLVKMDLAGNYSNLDIAPQEAIQVTFQPNETVKNVYINSPHRSERHTWKWDAQVLRKELNVELSPIISGLPGQTLTIPTTAPSAGFSVPSLQIPNVPALTLPAFSTSNSYCGKWVGNWNLSTSTPGVYLTNQIFNYSAINFSSTNGTVTIPVHGIYHMALTVNLTAPTNTHTLYNLKITLTGPTYHSGESNQINFVYSDINNTSGAAMVWDDAFEITAGTTLVFTPSSSLGGISGSEVLELYLVYQLP